MAGRNCYCDLWETDPKSFEERGIPRGFCGLCEVCNAPGHLRHFPGYMPYTGAWCDRHYRRTLYLHPQAFYGRQIWMAAGTLLILGFGLSVMWWNLFIGSMYFVTAVASLAFYQAWQFVILKYHKKPAALVAAIVSYFLTGFILEWLIDLSPELHGRMLESMIHFQDATSLTMMAVGNTYVAVIVLLAIFCWRKWTF